MSRQASFIIAIPYAVALATGAQEAPVAEWNRAYLAATEKQRSGDYTKANAILEPVVKAALQLARDDKVAAALFAGYASIQQDLGQWVRAEEFYRRAVAMWTRLRPDGPERIIALHGLALLYIQRGQYSKAEQVLKDLEPPPPSKTSWPPSLQPRILNSLGFLAFTRGDLQRAESLYLRSLALCESITPPPAIELGAALSGRGAIYVESGRAPQAVAVFQRSLEVLQDVAGPHHPLLVKPLLNLAAALCSSGNCVAAEPFASRAVTLAESTASEYTATALFEYSGILRQLHRKGEARAMESRARSILRDSVDSDPSAAYTVDAGQLAAGGRR